MPILMPSFPFSWKTNDVITLRKALDEGRALFYNRFLPLLNFPSMLVFSLFHWVWTWSHSTDGKGTKTGGVLALLLHHCGEKRTFQEISHFLPAASWLQAGLPSSYLTGWGASLAGSVLIKIRPVSRRRRGWSRRGRQTFGITILDKQNQTSDTRGSNVSGGLSVSTQDKKVVYQRKRLTLLRLTWKDIISPQRVWEGEKERGGEFTAQPETERSHTGWKKSVM